MKLKLLNTEFKHLVFLLFILLFAFNGDLYAQLTGSVSSVPLPTDRGRLKIVSIPDVKGGANLNVVRTDADTPLRGASPSIEKRQVPLSAIRENFIKDQADAGMNSIRLIWFEAWQKGYGYDDQYTDFSNPDQVAHTIAMLETYVNLASKYGMYCIINFHSAFQRTYDEAYATEMWTVVADYFKNRTHVAYETANEPSDDFNAWMQNAEMQKHANIYDLVKSLAPNTMQIVLTPNRLSDSYPTSVNLAGKLSSMTTIDWTNTVVGYHLYGGSLNGIRNLHKAYPALPTENNFPSGSGANKDPWGGVSLDDDWYTSQTCEKLGIGWLHWAITNDCDCYEGWYANWPLMLSDAQTKGWYWPKDVIPNTQSVLSEAETNYTVVSEAGSNGSIGPDTYGGTTCSNGTYLSLPDVGDEVSIAITVPFAGDYDVLIRVRSGYDGNPTDHIDGNAYEIRINDELKTTALVDGSVTTTIDVDSYYGTLISTPITLNAGVSYIRVKALNAWLKVDYVQAILIRDTQAPTVPTNLSSSNILSTKFTLSWTPSTDNVDVVSYDVYRGAAYVGTSPTNTLVVTGLVPNTTSLFTVVAKDAAANVSVASSSLSVTTKVVDVTIGKTSTPPTIDGTKEAIWVGTESTIGNVTVGTISSVIDLSATWTALWDNTNLYFFVSVTDDVIMIDGPEWYFDDRLELFIDAAYSRTTTFGAKQYQYHVRPTETTLKEIKLNALANTEMAYKAVDGGYNFEIRIPFATLGITPSLNMKFGIDVQVGDDDDGGGVDGKMSWYSTDDNTWQNPSLLGTAILGADPASSINVNLANPLISIYPNPAKEKLTISNLSLGSVISVVSLDGRVMSTQKTTGLTVDYDVSSWNKGVYLFKIQENYNLTIKRAIIY